MVVNNVHGRRGQFSVIMSRPMLTCSQYATDTTTESSIVQVVTGHRFTNENSNNRFTFRSCRPKRAAGKTAAHQTTHTLPKENCRYFFRNRY